MSKTSPPNSALEPPSSAEGLGEICHDFERAWEHGLCPRIEDFLGKATGAESTDLLHKLIQLDIVCRRRRGLIPRPDDYLARFSQLDAQWLGQALGAQADAEGATPTKVFEDSCLDPPPPRPCCPHCLHVLSPPTAAAVVSCPECGGSFRIEDVGATTTAEFTRQLGRFELLERVGQGSFGTVWRARDTELGRIVALKVPHPSLLSSAAYVERIRREARAAARLRHPNIVRLYEVVTLEGLPVLVSDFIEGVTLKDILEVRRLTFQEAAVLVAEVAEALHYAHDAGLVHRDVKPGNLMVESGPAAAIAPGTKGTSLGKPILVDFGLALRDEAEIVMTVEGQIIGTPAYMSPEQAAGQGHRVDRRSDVYSLGVVLYELLCGERPFRGSKAMLLHQVLHEEPRSPRRLNDRIPRDLETICLTAIAKEPAKRFATAGALAQDVRRFLRGEPIQARPVGKVERLWRWCRRNRAVAFLTSAVALSLVAGTILSSYFAIQAGEGERQARREKLLSDRRRCGAEINLAQQAWTAGQLALTRSLLDAQEPQDGCADLRGFEWYYLSRLCRLDLATLHGHQGPVRGLAFSPDGRWLASAAEDKAVIVWDMALGKEAFRLEGHTQAVCAVAFSPDGRHLASAANDSSAGPGQLPAEVKVWDLQARRQTFAVPGHRGRVLAVAFNPEGNRLACAGAQHGDHGGNLSPGEVRVWDLDAHRDAFVLSGPCAVTAVAFSPDGKRLATASQDQMVLVWDGTKGGAPLLMLCGHTAPVLSVAFSPDGRRLASAGWDQAVLIWNAATGEKIHSLYGHTASVQSVAFSPDGQHLASAGADCLVKLWDTGTWTEQQVLRGHTQRIHSVAFSPDGWRLASAGDDQTIKVWDAGGAREPRTLAGHGRGIHDVTFSPDGHQLATAGLDRTIKVWNVGLGLASQTFRGHMNSVQGVAFSPDGQRLASAGADRLVKVWSLMGGHNILSLRGHEDTVCSVAFHPDGRRLASAGSDRAVKVWDSFSGQELLNLHGHTAPVLAVRFSPDGGSLASAGADGVIMIWDADTGNRRTSWTGHRGKVQAVAFRPDSHCLASAGREDNLVILWDLPSGRVLHTLRGHSGPVLGVAFSPDGQRLASASADQTVKVWDTNTGHCLLNLEGHTGWVLGISFSPDGKHIASASYDDTVKVWDATSWTAERAEQHQAVGLLEFLFRTRRPQGEVVAHLQRDLTISDAVRRQALRLVQTYGQGLVHRDADLLVQSVATKTLLQPDILETIRTDPGLTEAVRHEAQALAQHFVEDPGRLHNVSRAAVQRLGQDRAVYQHAQRQAACACRLVPQKALYRTTLGMAHYRLGNYPEALEALTQPDQAGAEAADADLPARLAFLAMTQHQLRRTQEARATLDRLHEIMRQPRWTTQEDGQALLAEAEAVLKSRPAEGPK